MICLALKMVACIGLAIFYGVYLGPNLGSSEYSGVTAIIIVSMLIGLGFCIYVLTVVIQFHRKLTFEKVHGVEWKTQPAIELPIYTSTQENDATNMHENPPVNEMHGEKRNEEIP